MVSNKILFFQLSCILLYGLVNYAAGQEERCKADGDLVCISCSDVGECKLIDGSFQVQHRETCATDFSFICDHTIIEGVCSPMSPSTTKCYCSGSGPCSKDPNNDSSFVMCQDVYVFGSCSDNTFFDEASCGCVAA